MYVLSHLELGKFLVDRSLNVVCGFIWVHPSLRVYIIFSIPIKENVIAAECCVTDVGITDCQCFLNDSGISFPSYQILTEYSVCLCVVNYHLVPIPIHPYNVFYPGTNNCVLQCIQFFLHFFVCSFTPVFLSLLLLQLRASIGFQMEVQIAFIKYAIQSFIYCLLMHFCILHFFPINCLEPLCLFIVC